MFRVNVVCLFSCYAQAQINSSVRDGKFFMMKTGSKIIIATLDTGMILLLLFVLYILSTPPGLHYLAILYSGFGVVVLNTVRLIILTKNGRRSVMSYLPYLTILFTGINPFLEPDYHIMASLLAIVNCLLMFYVAYDFWQSDNLGSSIINRTINYFSVDLETKGWTERKNES